MFRYKNYTVIVNMCLNFTVYLNTERISVHHLKTKAHQGFFYFLSVLIRTLLNLILNQELIVLILQFIDPYTEIAQYDQRISITNFRRIKYDFMLTGRTLQHSGILAFLFRLLRQLHSLQIPESGIEITDQKIISKNSRVGIDGSVIPVLPVFVPSAKKLHLSAVGRI